MIGARDTRVKLTASVVALVIATSGGIVTHVRADEVTVPIALQIDLLGRVAAYERNYAAQAGAPAIVMIVTRRGNAESARAAGQIESGLRRASTMGGRPIQTITHAFTSASALRAAAASASAAIVYLTPGLGNDVAAIAAALDGLDVLSVSAVATDADRGIVLGFELVAARPKLVVNLRNARRQNVEFSSRFLRLARVIQ